MITRMRRWGAFWYDFIVGDDWRIVITVVLALALTAGLDRAGISAWWVLPISVMAVLPWNLWRARRRQ